MLKTIKIDKGVLTFYIILAIVALFCAFRLNNLNIASTNTDNNQVYCA